MSRPSRNQDRLLIDTAKRLYPRVGASAMSLKRIADEAGVNLGMFNYYFGSKSKFIRIVLAELAEEAGSEETVALPEGVPAIVRLRCLLIGMAKNFREHRQLALAMYRDFLNQDPDVTEHLLERTTTQTARLASLIAECQQEGSVDESLPVQQILGFCMGTVKTPIVIAASQERGPESSYPAPLQLSEGVARMLCDESIVQRVELTLRAIARPISAPRQ